MGLFSFPHPKSRRAIGRAFIPKLAKLGYNPARALSYLKLHSASYRKTTFLSDWRQILGIERKREPLKHVRKDRKATPNVIQKVKDEQKHRFKHTYKAVLYDTEEGKETTQHISIGTDYHQDMGVMDETAYIISTSFKYTEAQQFVLMKLERESITESTFKSTDTRPSNIAYTGWGGFTPLK
jgi:hypothetical protein